MVVPVTDEPALRVPRPPKPFYLRRRFLIRLAALAVLPAVGLTVLGGADQLLLPFERITVIEGKLGSKGEYFEDPKVQRLLMRHGIRVRIAKSSSREVAVNSLAGLDFAFPSGQPAAQLIRDHHNALGLPAKPYRPFVSPIVLATFTEYAQTLTDLKTARRQAGALYYDLDMDAFLRHVKNGATWKDLGIEAHGVRNGNRVLAQTPDVCAANSAATYLGLVAFLENGRNAVSTPEQAVAIARAVKPFITQQGLPAQEIFKTYAAPEGRQIAPVVVVYEHQFLAHQLAHRDRTGGPDRERVLMYPQPGFFPLPELISFTPAGDRLGELITSDAGLRERAVELGYRLLDNPSARPARDLAGLLGDAGIPLPVMKSPDSTRTVLPSVANLERMLAEFGCAPNEPS